MPGTRGTFAAVVERGSLAVRCDNPDFSLLPNFLKMLATGLRGPVQITAACGNVEAAEETLVKLDSAGIKGDFRAAPGGFTDFVVKRRIEPLLSAPTLS